MQLTFFDLDHTLLASDSDYEWGRFLIDEAVVDRAAYARANDHFKAQYEAGALDIHAYQRFALAPLIDNPAPRMTELRARFITERIAPMVAPQARAVLDYHRQRGDVIAIITATNRFVTEPIADLLGVEHLIATEPEMNAGVYTGEIAGTPCYRDGKIVRAQAFVERHATGFDAVTFYSDSHNDLPLLRWADHPFAVDPDPMLAEAARAAGWPIISFRGRAMPVIA